MCLCAALRAVPTRTRIVILQHPHERSHPFGTARLVGLCLPNAAVHTVYGGLRGDLLHPLELPSDTAVLYPHPEATDLAALPAAERPSTLLALDGTWAHATRLYRHNPWLQRLRHVRLHPEAPSRYRIRREPRDDYVSTLEAVTAALHILEPETPGLDALLAAFDHMIDRQIEHVAHVTRHGRRKLPRERPSRALSPLLADPDLVVTYAESSLPGGDVTAPRELVQLVAARLADGATLELILRPPAAFPSTCHLDHMGLSADDLAAGITTDEARARLRAFAGGGPLAAWTQSTLDWSRSVLPEDARCRALKIDYCNLRNRRASFLEAVVAREGIRPEVVACRGRAAARLGNALAVARWLRDERARQLTVAAG
jgi:DTW domain-containing protein YfiP